MKLEMDDLTRSAWNKMRAEGGWSKATFTLEEIYSWAIYRMIMPHPLYPDDLPPSPVAVQTVTDRIKEGKVHILPEPTSEDRGT